MFGGRMKSPWSSSPSLFPGGDAYLSEDGEGDDVDGGVTSDASGASTSSDCFGDETGSFDGVGAFTGSEFGVGASTGSRIGVGA
uniref:Uncharacterized protein n=1 Tax=Noccaea caerulescens TaxID=107243 RepID=A0A1J3I2U8_NOCCA